jgi:putative endonuclease
LLLVVVVSICPYKTIRGYSTTEFGRNKNLYGMDVYSQMCRRIVLCWINKKLDLRLAQHQSGKGSRYTSGRLPVELVYGEEYDRVADAYAREKEALIYGNVELLPPLAKKKFEKQQSAKSTPLVE